ncbi:MAG: hypothetical protein K9M98_12315 [Cephaloticoccus sp.]|nr:hypothetical protein [Cephaloticoccus sp.]
MSSLRKSLANGLNNPPTNHRSVVVGFDGFVDEMITVVGERQALDRFTPVARITDFAGLIGAAAGRSSLREIVVNAVHPGGCAVNMGDGLAALGIPVDCFATLGEPPHPAFAETTARFRSVQSWGREPGRTLAYEFTDGKLMFSSVTQLAEFDVPAVTRYLADGRYLTACREAGVIALTDWSLYPHMTEVWRFLCREVYRQLPQRTRFLIDLVDPASRAAVDIEAMLAVLPSLQDCGEVCLSLNGNEANILARLLGLPVANEQPEEALILGRSLQQRLGVAEVVIHFIRCAAAAGNSGEAAVCGPYCENPRKSTGAGDRFNAGYALGILLGATPSERLALGCGTSGYFVRHGQSPDRAQLAEMLTSDNWPD